MQFIFIAFGLLVGLLIAYLFFQLKQKSQENEWVRTQSQLEERVKNQQTENERITERLEEVKIQREQQLQQLAKAEAEFAGLREKLITQKQEMEDLQKIRCGVFCHELS